MNAIEGDVAGVGSAATTLPHPIRDSARIGELVERGRTPDGVSLPADAVSPPSPPSPPSAPSAPEILITENEVVFGTAAAVPVRPVRRWRRFAVINRMWVTPNAEGARPRQDCPRRYAFLESSGMAREMHRL